MSFKAKILVQEPTQNFTVEVWSNNGTHWFNFWWNQECPVLPNRRLHEALMKCFSCIKENRCGQSHEKLSCDLLWVPTGQSFLQIWEVAPAESEYSSGSTSPPKARFLDSDLGCCRLHATIFYLVKVLAKYLSALETVGNLIAGWGPRPQGPTEAAHKLVLPLGLLVYLLWRSKWPSLGWQERLSIFLQYSEVELELWVCPLSNSSGNRVK